MTTPRWITRTNSPEDTRRLGERLAEHLRPGHVVLLSGDLGSGKTTLAQGICRGLGVDEWASSPTYILINEYHGRMPVYHCDFYRIGDPSELDTLAIDDVFYGNGVALVEWPELEEDWAPPDAVRVRVEADGPACREFTVSGLDGDVPSGDVSSGDAASAH